MSVPILNVLSDGPTPYGEFIGLGLSKTYADIHLRLLRKRKAITLDNKGRYHIPAEPPKDTSLRDGTTVKGHCRVCSGPLYRRTSKYCSKGCTDKSKEKPKSVCKRAGCENKVKEMDHRYCSHECRWPNRRGA
jgi:predicted nucleic acid-binding Zn ribbon protein